MKERKRGEIFPSHGLSREVPRQKGRYSVPSQREFRSRHISFIYETDFCFLPMLNKIQLVVTLVTIHPPFHRS